MRYLELLGGLHDALRPATYLEIGVRHGDSLALSRARTIGVDPAFAIKRELDCPLTLVRTTSDEFFGRPDALEPFAGEPPSLAFIDGLHLFEHALRDFMHVEERAAWWSVVVFDDVLPRDAAEASRERQTQAWTGDVFKVGEALRRHRPDLICLPVDTEPTGLLLVLGADPESDVLARHYEELLAELVVPDPQEVPADVLRRAGALDPGAVLRAPVWALLREARERRLPREEGMARLRRCVAELLGRPADAA
ncbi:MAG TPA: class I SAM-dependent methyltransferase [Baekduia sp.]|nr:class I SAM-dependent methyltransferase [Baekduia sp.]